MPNGTLFYDWLAANDATFHRDLLIVRNGVKLGDDDELAFELSELDHIQIFDQPKGIVDDILSPIFKVVGGIFVLAPKPAIANNGGNTVDSPNNSLTGQTNTARVYKAKPDIYGQIRSFPDLIQESVFEYVHQTSTDGGLKYVTEWMCIGIGKYDYESVRYSESSWALWLVPNSSSSSLAKLSRRSLRGTDSMTLTVRKFPVRTKPATSLSKQQRQTRWSAERIPAAR